MRRIIIIWVILALSLSLAAPGYCDGPVKKLGRGVSNLITWPLELFHRIGETNRRAGPAEAATYGLFEGGCMMILRAAVGFWEVVTFPFPVPEDYGPVLTDPEFFIQFPQKR